MVKLTADTSVRALQQAIREIYALPNDRQFELAEMLVNIQRFAMRGLKGIRKGDAAKTKKNLIISFCWFLSTLNRLHIDLDDELWRRFPYACSYCASAPCSCRAQRVEQRQHAHVDIARRPATLEGVQAMFAAIYPPAGRTLDQAGVHLAEETGEFSEALVAFRGERSEERFSEVMLEAADYTSCLLGVFNSLGVSLAQELSALFTDGCHECGHAPCRCTFKCITDYKV